MIMKREKIILSWSGGKDCAMALHQLRRGGDYEVVSLLTVLTEGYDRISMHGVRRELLEIQAKAMGLPLEKVYIPQQCSMEDYSQRMKRKMLQCKADGINTIAFGDIFLEELRIQREENLKQVSMEAIFPLWKKNTSKLAQDFIAKGFKSVITCSDSKVTERKVAGKKFDLDFISGLPCGVDPCGENGEFHSFVYDGPVFDNPVPFTIGTVELRDNRFYFCDLVTD